MLLTFAVTILAFKVNEIFANLVVNSDFKKLFHQVVVNVIVCKINAVNHSAISELL